MKLLMRLKDHNGRGNMDPAPNLEIANTLKGSLRNPEQYQ